MLLERVTFLKETKQLGNALKIWTDHFPDRMSITSKDTEAPQPKEREL